MRSEPQHGIQNVGSIITDGAKEQARPERECKIGRAAASRRAE